MKTVCASFNIWAYDKFEFDYPEDEVKEICRVLQKLIINLIEKYSDEMGDMFPSITGKVATLAGNFGYIYAMHCQETTYALLKEIK